MPSAPDTPAESYATPPALALTAVLDELDEGVLGLDSAGVVSLFNQRLLDLFRLDANCMPRGMGLPALLKKAELPPELVVPGGPARDIGPVHGRLLRLRGVPASDGSWIGLFQDITEQRRTQELVTRLSERDSVTGLLNRMAFKAAARELFARSQTGRCALLLLNLDRFKIINDTLGQSVGDAVLCQVAQRLGNMLRQSDVLACLGGDEFAVLVPDIGQEATAGSLASRLLACLRRPFVTDAQSVRVTGSIGVALSDEATQDAEVLLRHADLALLTAKVGGDGWRHFRVEMGTRACTRRALEHDLRIALERNEFELFYQPLMDIDQRRVCGFEALLRWHHPVRGMVGPEVFIPLAEEIGLIVPIGAWVLRTACAAAAALPDHVSIAVNLSAVQFSPSRRQGSGREDSLLHLVTEALARAELPAHRLELEVTESVLLSDDPATLHTLHALQALGVRISLDDFGTGYASLSYLSRFPFDKIKIDQSFVHRMTSSTENGAIVRAIAGLGVSLGIITTAEGVETRAQLDAVIADGCREVQGFFFSPPRPARCIPDLLQLLLAAGA